jgi:hypothetical protein
MIAGGRNQVRRNGITSSAWEFVMSSEDCLSAAFSPLIRATAPDGARFVFALSSEPRQCCVMRNGDPIFTAPTDDSGITAAVDLLLRACDAGAEPDDESWRAEEDE